MFETRVLPARLAGSESLVAELYHWGSRLLTIFCLYRAPSGELPLFLEDLTAVIKSLPAGSLLVGDVNIDLNPNKSAVARFARNNILVAQYRNFNR